MGNWLETAEKGPGSWGGSLWGRESQAFGKVISEEKGQDGVGICVGRVGSGLVVSGEAIIEAGSQ